LVAAQDTARFERRTAELHPPDVAEGITVVGFYEDGQLRVARSISFGETGKAEATYLFGSSDNLSIVLIETRYRRPISLGEPVDVLSADTLRAVICDGVLKGDSTAAVRAFIDDVKEIRALLHGAPG